MSNVFAAVVLASFVSVVPFNRVGAPAPRTASPAVTASVAAQEKHPKIRAALAAIDAAKVELKAAAHDFGGHRVDAIKALDQAAAQLNLALNYDKK